jgi:adenosylcobinamide-phosphate synthase
MESLNIALAYFLDIVLGDPRWLPHPVKIMGRSITFLEKRLRSGQQAKILRIRGTALTLIVVGASAFSAYLVLAFMRKINPVAGSATWVFLAYTCLATKDLLVHARAISREIKVGNIFAAQKKLSRIVGRDTELLSESEIIKATVESIAENTNDGIIAPLFYLILGGPVLGIVYKAANTLDSMVGHKDEKYMHFGWFSARLDDIANFIPARISGLLIAISSFISGKDSKNSLKVMRKDGNKHPSPNAGFPEAAMAGALGIKLGGPSTYEGRLCIKPYIGEDKGSLQLSLIEDALTIAFISSILMLSIGVLLRWVI